MRVNNFETSHILTSNIIVHDHDVLIRPKTIIIILCLCCGTMYVCRTNLRRIFLYFITDIIKQLIIIYMNKKYINNELFYIIRGRGSLTMIQYLVQNRVTVVDVEFLFHIYCLRVDIIAVNVNGCTKFNEQIMGHLQIFKGLLII